MPRCARIADDKYVSDDKVLNWVNHSCGFNSKLDIDREDPVLIAIRDILPDEEIIVNYNETEIQVRLNVLVNLKIVRDILLGCNSF